MFLHWTGIIQVEYVQWEWLSMVETYNSNANDIKLQIYWCGNEDGLVENKVSNLSMDAANDILNEWNMSITKVERSCDNQVDNRKMVLEMTQT